MEHKDIGDTLTDPEINDLTYRLRNINNKTLDYNITNQVQTEYGTLVFDYGTEYYKRKNGLLSNNLKAKLTNPLYNDADYKIRLTFEDRSSTPLDTDTPTVFTNEYQLPVDEWVTITEADLDTLTRYTSTLYIDYRKNQLQKLDQITITSNKTHVVEDETCTITGKVYTNNGNLIDGEPVEVYIDDELDTTLTMSDKKVTYTYTGQGDTAHLLTFKAKNDNTCSNDYMVKDCYYDDGDWYNHQSRVTIDSDGVLSYNGDTWAGYYADTTGEATSINDCKQHTKPFSFEFDIQNPYGDCYIEVSDGTNDNTCRRKFIRLSQTKKEYHVKVEVLSDQIKYYVDGVYKSNLTWSGEMPECYVDFRLYKGSSLKFTNFIMYSLGDAEPVTPVDTVTLSANPTTVTIGSSTTLTATVTLEDESPGAGKTVTFYDGSSSIGTATTNSNGVATLSYSPLTSGSKTIKATCGGVDSSTVTLTVNKVTTTLSLSGSGVTYPNSVSLSGTLSAGTGKTVKIYQDDTLIDTISTTTGGAFTKTVTGLDAGSYTFKATFDGDTTYSTVTSSDLTVVVSKATPTISLSSSSATVSVGQSFTLSGTLSVGTGQSVKIYAGDTLVDTVTTGSGGAYSKTITPSVAGTYTYKATFEATTNYNTVTSSNVSVTVESSPTPTPTPASVSLASDKDILSYYDSESATLSATVLDANSQACEGVTVEFFNGSTSMGTATTNSSGIATKSYTSTGAGDVTFTAEVSNLVSETYVEDCNYFNDGSSVSNLEIDSGVSCTTNGTFITITKSSSGEKYVRIPATINGDWEYTVEVAELGIGQYATFVFNSSYWGAIGTNGITVNLNDSSSTYTHTASAGDILKIRYVSGTITVYVNDTSLKTKSASISNTKHGFFTNSGRTQKIKNIKLKSL